VLSKFIKIFKYVHEGLCHTKLLKLDKPELTNED
jgi:hypothetical protein